MNIARIVVFTIALNAGGVAACLASGSDSKQPPAEPVAQLRTAEVLATKADSGLGWPTSNSIFIRRGDRLELKPEQTSTPVAGRQAGTLSLAPRNVADTNQVEVGSDDHTRQRGNINVGRHGLDYPTIMQNRAEGST